MLMNPTPQATQARRLLLALTCTMALAPSVWAQTPAPQTDATTKADAGAAKKVPVEPAKKDEEKVELSPFVVTTAKDSGYFAANTLAGSRMKTNLADLGAAISV